MRLRISKVGAIVPEAIEHYLAGLNHLADAVLDVTSRKPAPSAELPLIDAEVGALLRVLATAVGAIAILEIGTAIGYSGNLARRRAAARRHAADDGGGAGAGEAGPREFRARRAWPIARRSSWATRS